MKIFDFGAGIPDCLEVKGGSISITELMVKQGTGSLRWDFEEGDQLIFCDDIGYKKLEVNGEDMRDYIFSMFLFGINASGSLRVSFEKDGEEKTGFNVNLDFKGWRSVSVCYDRDMEGIPVEGMDALVITAHGEGSLLFSEVLTAGRIDHRAVWKSYQVPDIKYNALIFKKDWTLSEKYKDVPVDPESVSMIKDKVHRYLMAEYVNGKTFTFQELEAAASKLQITRNELGLNGKRVEYQIHRRLMQGTEWEKEEYINLATVTRLLLNLAAYYNQSREECAAQLYLEVLEYLMYQGLEEGSSFGSHWILFYGMRSLYNSVLLMEDVLAKSGLSERLYRAMQWFLHVSQMGYCDELPAKNASSDSFYNDARGVLYSILLMPDEKVQAGFLRAFKEWIDKNLKTADGLLGILKEDGCVYHHHGHYIAYGIGGMEGMTSLIYILNGSAYQVETQTYENVRKVLWEMHFQCHGERVPIVFSGRHPLGKMVLPLCNYKYFALAAIENGDREAAGLYVNLKKEPTDEFDRIIFDAIPEETVNGDDNRSYPMACATVHKRDGFTAVAKGFSRYMWGSETYVGNNQYGRYRSYGVLELINKESHFSHDGYDWNRFPGSTTIHLPFEKLRTNILNVDSHSGFEEMLISDQRFAGGVSMDKNGMYSMILKEHQKYNGSHTAHKSIFFHDDFILLLGSDISNVSEYETETTMFQVRLADDERVALLNGETFCGEREVQSGDVFTDNLGNHYYVKMGTRVSVSCGQQESRSSTDDSVTTGAFASAVIRHGISPECGSYEYGIGVNGAALPEYKVLRQDHAVHAVQIGNITYAAIFEPDSLERIKVNMPVLLMVKKDEKGCKIAVSNPDLGLYDEDPSQYDENGMQKEVSIYSRKWVNSPVAYWNLNLEIEELGVSVSAVIKGGSTYEFT